MNIGKWFCALVVGFMIFDCENLNWNLPTMRLQKKSVKPVKMSAKRERKRLNIRFSPLTTLKVKRDFFLKFNLRPVAFDVFGYDVVEWEGSQFDVFAAKLKNEFEKFKRSAGGKNAAKSFIWDYQVEDGEKRAVPFGGCIQSVKNSRTGKVIHPWYDRYLWIELARKFLAEKKARFAPQGIVIVDDGPYMDHPDIAPAIKIGDDGKRIFWSRDKAHPPDGNHGTHVACIAAAYQDGKGMEGIAAPNAYILPLVVNYDDKDLYFASDIAIGLKYFVELEKTGAINFRVVNMSFGFTRELPILKSAINYLSGKLFVVAAGNEKHSLSEKKLYPASWRFPNVIAVAATDENDRLAGFSNYDIDDVDIAAPGTHIVSCVTGDEYEEYSGTSMSTPLVAGTLQLMLAMKPSMSVETAKRVLFASSVSKASLERKVKYNRRLYVLGAVQQVWQMMQMSR
jgi:hypothetical protein